MRHTGTGTWLVTYPEVEVQMDLPRTFALSIHVTQLRTSLFYPAAFPEPLFIHVFSAIQMSMSQTHV